MMTVPLGSATSTGPVTAVPECASVHVMRAATPWTVRSLIQRPVRLSADGGGVGVDGVSSLHAGMHARASTKSHRRMRMHGLDAKFVPCAGVRRVCYCQRYR